MSFEEPLNHAVRTAKSALWREPHAKHETLPKRKPAPRAASAGAAAPKTARRREQLRRISGLLQESNQQLATLIAPALDNDHEFDALRREKTKMEDNFRRLESALDEIEQDWSDQVHEPARVDVSDVEPLGGPNKAETLELDDIYPLDNPARVDASPELPRGESAITSASSEPIRYERQEAVMDTDSEQDNALGRASHGEDAPRAARLEDEIRDAEQRLESLADQCESLEQMIADKQAAARTITAQIEAAQAHSEQLACRVSGVQQDIETLLREKVALEEAITGHFFRGEALPNASAVESDDLKQIELVCNHQRAELERLDQLIGERTAKADEWEAYVAGLSAEADRLEAALAIESQ